MDRTRGSARRWRCAATNRVPTSHTNVVTAPAVSASCKRASLSASAAACCRRSANSAASTYAQSRDSQDAGASSKHAVRHRETGIAEVTDPDRRRPDDCERDDEGCRRSEHRPATRRDPQQDRKQQRDRHDRRPRLRRQCDDDDAHDDKRRRAATRPSMVSFRAGGSRVAEASPMISGAISDDAERVGCEPVLPGDENSMPRAPVEQRQSPRSRRSRRRRLQ